MVLVVVHSILPASLSRAVDGVLASAGVSHIAHGDADPVGAASAGAQDEQAVALIGPVRSAHVAEAVEVTAPARLPLIAPFATAAAVTRDDEPGCEDPAQHDGTVFRLVARDTVVAQRVTAHIAERGQRALVVAGRHEYGAQLDGQLRIAGLPRADDPATADVIVLAALAGSPEVDGLADRVRLPVIAFDGVQGADLGSAGTVHVALPFSPDAAANGHVRLEPTGRRAAELVVAALRSGARSRSDLLDALRSLGPFDAHGDPVDPPVWLWRADEQWRLTPDRAL
jgi:hypothetical protein